MLNASDATAKTKFCCSVLSATRPSISIERLSARRVGSIAALKKRELPTVASMMKNGTTATMFARSAYARRSPSASAIAGVGKAVRENPHAQRHCHYSTCSTNSNDLLLRFHVAPFFNWWWSSGFDDRAAAA